MMLCTFNLCLSESQGHIDAVSVLLCHNVPCDSKLKTEQGCVTPALQAGCCGYHEVPHAVSKSFAEAHVQVVRLLLQAKADANSRIWCGFRRIMASVSAQISVVLPSQPKSPDHGNTIAIKAAQGGHYKVLQVLHELAPYSLTLCNAQGETVLQELSYLDRSLYALTCACPQVAQAYRSVRCIQFLGTIDIDLAATDRRWDRSVMFYCIPFSVGLRVTHR